MTRDKKYTPFIDRTHMNHMGGVQKVYQFDNGYGASVIQTSMSYGGREGKWELGVVWFTDEKHQEWDLVYDTPVANDVIGYLTQKDVDKLLGQIDALPIRTDELIEAKKKADAKRKRYINKVLREHKIKKAKEAADGQKDI